MGKKARSSSGVAKAMDRKINKLDLPPPPPPVDEEVSSKDPCVEYINHNLFFIGTNISSCLSRLAWLCQGLERTRSTWNRLQDPQWNWV